MFNISIFQLQISQFDQAVPDVFLELLLAPKVQLNGFSASIYLSSFLHELELDPRVGPHIVGAEKSHMWGGRLAIFEVSRGCF